MADVTRTNRQSHATLLRWALVLAGAALLGACATTPPAPVEDRSGAARGVARSHAPPPTTRGSATYRVQRGDTLYSIAFRNGLDYRDLARRNGIQPPYTIYVGQRLTIDVASPSVTESAARVAAAPSVPSRPAGTPPAAPTTRTNGTPAPSQASTAPSALASTPRPSTTPPSATSTPAAPVVAPTPAVAASGGELRWQWPAEGLRIAGYVAGDQTRQGVDIAGKAGDPVRAAADGEVVYSGNGLIGYGELIIVKHNATLLSAYGHNRKRLVQEGDKVRAGQQIAEMGASSASRDMLHFEIRRNGKPVNPLDYLPVR